MATTTDPKPDKRLRELLQEKQDPFVLHLYLVEKGYLTNGFNSRKSKKKSITCSKVLRAVYSRLRIRRFIHRNASNVAVREIYSQNNQETGELNRFSSASRSSSTFNSCSCASHAEETSDLQQKHHLPQKESTSRPLTLCNPVEEEAVIDRNLSWQCIEETKQRCPVPLSEAAASHRAFPLLQSIKYAKKVTDHSILSASLLKVLVQSANDKKSAGSANDSTISSQYLKSKTVLQQTRQLLFDCVRELVDNQETKEKLHRQHKEYFKYEQLRKHIAGDKNWGRENQLGEESNLAGSSELELYDSERKWKDFEMLKRVVVSEIGEAIFEDLRTDIVVDMIDYL